MIEPVALQHFLLTFFARARVGYFVAQAHPWFVPGMWWRQIFGWMFAAGLVLLAWDMLTIGRSERRPALVHAQTAAA
jgi:nitric oxide reductase subunit B